MTINTDPSSRQHVIVLTCIITPIVSSVFVVIRVWTRVFIGPYLGWDDYTAILTMLSCIVFSILLGLTTNHGMGWHSYDMSPEVFSGYKKGIYVSSVFYILSLLGYKVSILLLYLRLFKVHKFFKYTTWVVLFVVFGYLLCNFCTQLFGCTPAFKFWHPDEPGRCIDFIKSDIAYGLLNIISDFVIFVLPIPMVWHLKLSRKEKIGISLVFTVGAIAGIVAAIRTSYMLRDLHASDSPWLAGETFLWMVLEVNTGLMCSCTPSFKPFLIHIFGGKGFSFGSRRPSGPPPRGRALIEGQKGSGEAGFIHAPFQELGSFPSDRGDGAPWLDVGSRSHS